MVVKSTLHRSSFKCW